MGHSHRSVTSLTPTVSRHMLHITLTHPCTFLPMVLSRARARARARRGYDAVPPHVPLGLSVSHADGLSQGGLCIRLGTGVRAVLGPSQRRFAF